MVWLLVRVIETYPVPELELVDVAMVLGLAPNVNPEIERDVSCL